MAHGESIFGVVKSIYKYFKALRLPLRPMAMPWNLTKYTHVFNIVHRISNNILPSRCLLILWYVLLYNVRVYIADPWWLRVVFYLRRRNTDLLYTIRRRAVAEFFEYILNTFGFWYRIGDVRGEQQFEIADMFGKMVLCTPFFTIRMSFALAAVNVFYWIVWRCVLYSKIVRWFDVRSYVVAGC